LGCHPLIYVGIFLVFACIVDGQSGFIGVSV
jgi:hypothetical protein